MARRPTWKDVHRKRNGRFAKRPKRERTGCLGKLFSCCPLTLLIITLPFILLIVLLVVGFIY